MEIVNIEAEVFEEMGKHFAEFSQRVEDLCSKHRDKALSKWLDNQDVCVLLNISKRTLQTYRDNGTLAYTQIGHKMFYKPEDIKRILPLIQKKK